MFFLSALLLPVVLSVLFCWFFTRYGNPLFVAKPRDWTPDRHHQTKQGIPTMGGIVLIGIWLLFMFFFAWRADGAYVLLPALWVIASFGALGAYDDWSKIQRTGGISASAKFIAQNICAL